MIKTHYVLIAGGTWIIYEQLFNVDNYDYKLMIHDCPSANSTASLSLHKTTLLTGLI